jgi:hemoglobin
LKLDLFQAIGGRSKINAAVEIFYRKVLADPALRGFFDASDMNGVRAKQAMFLTMLLGGEQRYSGKDIGLAHAPSRQHGLTDAHFDAFVRHLYAALDEIGVAPDIVAQIAKKLESTRGSILGR